MSLTDRVLADVAELVTRVRELENEVRVLREIVADRGEEPPELALMLRYKLTRAEASVLAMLHTGRAMNRHQLELGLPARDHARERNPKIVDVIVCHLRKKMPGSIETIHGLGWRLTDQHRTAA